MRSPGCLCACITIHVCVCVCVYVTAQSLSHMTDFHEVWYKWYASGRHPNAIHRNFLQTVLTKWLMTATVQRQQH